MRKLVIAAIALGAALAFAGTVNITDTFVFQTLFKPWARTSTQLNALTPSAYTGYVAYDSTKGAVAVSNGTAWVSSGANALAPCSTTYNFPVIGGGAGACADSWVVACPGAAATSGCMVSTNFGVDGGIGLLSQVLLNCRGVDGGGIVRACSFASDAGAGDDLTDAGYTLRFFN